MYQYACGIDSTQFTAVTVNQLACLREPKTFELWERAFLQTLHGTAGSFAVPKRRAATLFPLAAQDFLGLLRKDHGIEYE